MVIGLYACKLAKNILNLFCSVLKGNRMCKAMFQHSVFSMFGVIFRTKKAYLEVQPQIHIRA